jgi:hypothetical protein
MEANTTWMLLQGSLLGYCGPHLKVGYPFVSVANYVCFIVATRGEISD